MTDPRFGALHRLARIAITVALPLVPATGTERATVPTVTAADGATLLLSTYIGQSEADSLYSIVFDDEGNYYVSGIGSLAPLAAVPETLIGSGDDNPYVAKFRADGSPVFLTRVGGSSGDYLDSAQVDAQGNVYLAGVTYSPDFPVVNPPRDSSPLEPGSIVVVKLSPDGSEILYTAFLGPSENVGRPIQFNVTSSGEAVVAGETTNPEFPTVNAIDDTLTGYGDAFIAKIAADGSRVAFSTFLGGEGSEIPIDSAVDRDGNVYVIGWAEYTVGFPVVNPAIPLDDTGNRDGWIVKLASDGSAIVYASLLGGPRTDLATAVAVDDDGAAYVAGSASLGFPFTGRTVPSDTKPYGLYLLKLSPSGSQINFARLLSGLNGIVTHIAIDDRKAITLVGNTISEGFPVVSPWQARIAYDRRYTQPAEEPFVGVLPPSASAFEFLTYLGGKKADYINGVAFDGAGSTYLVGGTWSNDFPTKRSLVPYPNDDNANGFLVKYAWVAPPVVTSATTVLKPGKPFKLRLSGSNLQSSVQVYVGGDAEPWPQVKATGATAILKGDGLAERFPAGTPVTIRVINPDRGGTYFVVAR
jgi:hypothetical protein